MARRVAITGSTGLIGEGLVEQLRRHGHTVHRMVRSRDRVRDGEIYWSSERQEIDGAALEGVDAVVHLAGEPIGKNRWTQEVRRRIMDSRADGTRLIAETLADLDRPPAVLVSGSAVGFYGDRGEEILTEESGPGADFVANVVQAWEAAAAPAADAGIRVVHPRTGVVMAGDGPLIEKVELPFKLGLGGRIGHGRQYVPWIALEDEVRALEFLIDHDLSGPVNLVTPDPVTNRELTAALGDVFNRPTVLPIPPFAIRLLYGEMGVSLATVSQRVLPTRLLEAGFEFSYTDLRAALRAALA